MPLAQAADPMGITDLGGIRLVLDNDSQATAISADGSTVVGIARDDSYQSRAFVWRNDGTTMTDLSTLSGHTSTYSYARAVNADGTVIVGETSNGSTSRAFRWTSATGTMDELGTLQTGAQTSSSFAYGVSADGTIVVGEAINDDNQFHAFRWVEGAGMAQLFTAIDGNIIGTSAAYAVNKAGDVVVGQYYYNGNTGAFRWVANDGVQSLGALDQDTNTDWNSSASGVNAAGTVVVGSSSNGTDATAPLEAFRWTAETGMVGLGTLSGFTDSFGSATDSTGNVVVGTLYDSTATQAAQGFRWESGTGMQTVEQWLEASGVDTSVMTDHTETATGVSADGSIVVGQLSSGRAYLARGKSGVIDLAAFNTSLSRTAASAVLAENQNDLVFHGMHGNPMQTLLARGKSGFWAAGDFGRQERDARKSDIIIGEVGYGHRINDSIQVNVAAGHTYSSAKTDNGGRTRVNGNFILPEMIVSLPGSLYATVSGIYARGVARIDRGYINAGVQSSSKGSPDTTTFGARIRLDAHEMADIGGVMLTPYVGLSYLQTRIDGYTEKGGGFPVRWKKREEEATTARVGVDAAKSLGNTLKITGRIEGVHRFEDENAGASGQIVGLGDFKFDGQNLKQNWLRVGVGLEGRVGSGIASATINTTTEGEAAAHWLAVNYRWQF